MSTIKQPMSVEAVEDLFTELLYIALIAPYGKIQDLLTNIVIQIGDTLPEEAVERSKSYATYRAQQLTPPPSI